MTQLSVNVNKIATLRNARGQNTPDLIKITQDIMSFGAHGITVHPRPDERHIKREDVFLLKPSIQEFNKKNQTTIEFNIEGYPSSDFIELIQQIQPEQVTLVPDPPDVITSNAGWELNTHFDFLSSVIEQLQTPSTRVSLFVDPKDFDQQELQALLALQPKRIELYTEAYATHFGQPLQNETLALYKSVAQTCHSSGIGVNAGHDLSQKNLAPLLSELQVIQEVSIGHALICESLYQGIETTMKNYLAIMNSVAGTY